ncbi:hypothetical protein CDIK_2732 [Cucumispora dikerogammari]|nr:hypothetical protein CDIK_2732 [Cucumispora dikerogammari]
MQHSDLFFCKRIFQTHLFLKDLLFRNAHLGVERSSGDKPKLKYMKGPKCENTGTISSTVTNAFDIRTSLTRTSKIRNLKLSHRANRENLAIVSHRLYAPKH